MVSYLFFKLCCALCAPLSFLASPVPAIGSGNFLAKFSDQNREPQTDHVMSVNSIHPQATNNRSPSKIFEAFQPCLSSALKGNIGSRNCLAMISIDYDPLRIPQQFPVVKCLNTTMLETKCEDVKYNIPMLYKEIRQDKSVVYTSKWTSVGAGCIESILPTYLTHRKAETVSSSEMH